MRLLKVVEKNSNYVEKKEQYGHIRHVLACLFDFIGGYYNDFRCILVRNKSSKSRKRNRDYQFDERE